jgi:formate/nitrite transporter
MTVALCSRRIGVAGLLRNWALVYLGNLVGSIGLALIIAKGSGLLAGPVGGTAIEIAAAKVSSAQIGGIEHNLAFFFRGIACNWLVCLAIVMAAASRSASGKFLGVFFPIMAFVASGFEHCVANMYFIPAGIFAKGFEAARLACDVRVAELGSVTWVSMWTQNLISVTLGNIVGGAVFVGATYFLAHVRGTDLCGKELALVHQPVGHLRVADGAAVRSEQAAAGMGGGSRAQTSSVELEPGG